MEQHERLPRKPHDGRFNSRGTGLYWSQTRFFFAGFVQPVPMQPTESEVRVPSSVSSHSGIATRLPTQVEAIIFRRKRDAVEYLLLKRLPDRNGFWQPVRNLSGRWVTV